MLARNKAPLEFLYLFIFDCASYLIVVIAVKKEI